jgi:hypothetical protein
VWQPFSAQHSLRYFSTTFASIFSTTFASTFFFLIRDAYQAMDLDESRATGLAAQRFAKYFGRIRLFCNRMAVSSVAMATRESFGVSGTTETVYGLGEAFTGPRRGHGTTRHRGIDDTTRGGYISFLRDERGFQRRGLPYILFRHPIPTDTSRKGVIRCVLLPSLKDDAPTSHHPWRPCLERGMAGRERHRRAAAATP